MKEHTGFSKVTRENLKQYLAHEGRHLYTKRAGSSEGAVWEGPDYTATLRLTDLTQTHPIDYALFEYFPGIMIRVSKSDKDKIDIPCYKNVAAYCADFIKPTFGAMEVSREHRDIYFKFEIPIRENALTENTIEAIEKRASEVIAKHRDNLAFLANTYVPYKKFRKIIQDSEAMREAALGGEPYAPVDERMFNASLDSIRNHLEKHSNHNVVAEATDEFGNPVWKCEIFTNHDHYFLDLSADKRTGMLILKAMDGPKNIPIDEDARREVATYMAENSSVRKVGYLWCGDDQEGMCYVTTASLVDGVIGGETIELIEGLLLKNLDDVRAKAYALAYGEEVEDDGKVSDTSRLDSLRKMLERDRKDSDSDDDDEPHMPFGSGRPLDFSSMMADVLARTRGAHEDQGDVVISDGDVSDIISDTTGDLGESDGDDNDEGDYGDSGNIADILNMVDPDRPRASGD